MIQQDYAIQILLRWSGCLAATIGTITLWRRWLRNREHNRKWPRAHGRFLTYIAMDRGLRRRWLEPDFMLRRRIELTIRSFFYRGRPAGVSWANYARDRIYRTVRYWMK